jgi:hypothetical protein
MTPYNMAVTAATALTTSMFVAGYLNHLASSKYGDTDVTCSELILGTSLAIFGNVPRLFTLSADAIFNTHIDYLYKTATHSLIEGALIPVVNVVNDDILTYKNTHDLIELAYDYVPAIALVALISGGAVSSFYDSGIIQGQHFDV